MKEHPIIFSSEMVRVILDGRKTMTRRIVKKHPLIEAGFTIDFINDPGNAGLCPYGQPGDRLWVRENIHRGKEGNLAFYAADKGLVTKNGECVPWIFNEPHVSSIHMPRWASRITLEITDIRIERLQDISEDDAEAEGAHGYTNAASPIDFFICLWNSLNTKRNFSWDMNPWVWVISFKRIEEGRKL